jgi:hypothetical protein
MWLEFFMDSVKSVRNGFTGIPLDRIWSAMENDREIRRARETREKIEGYPIQRQVHSGVAPPG